MSELQGLFFWGFLLVFGIVMYLVAPRSKDEAGFFRGHDADGRPASEWALTMSIFISWIFAKSVTNAANLGIAETQNRAARAAASEFLVFVDCDDALPQGALAEVEKALDHVVKTTVRVGKTAAVTHLPVTNFERLSQFVQMGARMIGFSPLGFMLQGVPEYAKRIRELAPG